MDVYLPADFHALHDEVVTDWRDMSSDSRAASVPTSSTAQHAEQDADPNWLAI